jgi:DNA-binding response OmpR family regulator
VSAQIQQTVGDHRHVVVVRKNGFQAACDVHRDGHFGVVVIPFGDFPDMDGQDLMRVFREERGAILKALNDRDPEIYGVRFESKAPNEEKN